MQSGIQIRQRELETILNQYSDWEDRYKKIIEMGKKLPPLDDAFKIETNIVKGCQSQVWLHSELNPQGQVLLKADSDALIVKGLVSIILHVYNTATPEEILSTPPEFMKSLGLESHLSPSRANGLRAMIQKIVMQAMAYERKIQNPSGAV
jgi:cysteine desulfuration protein SufE